MNNTTIQKLRSVTTLKDYLDTLQSNFKTKDCKPGRLIKYTLVHTILNKLDKKDYSVNDELKNKAMDAENIDIFINVIKNNFDTSIQFSERAKENLISDTKSLVIMTRLEEV